MSGGIWGLNLSAYPGRGYPYYLRLRRLVVTVIIIASPSWAIWAKTKNRGVPGGVPLIPWLQSPCIVLPCAQPSSSFGGGEVYVLAVIV